MSFPAIIDKWLGRASSLATFAAPIVPGTLGGIVLGWASQGVAWINHYGAFGWISSGLMAFLAIETGLAMAARTRLWRVNAEERERVIGDGSQFDPMARVFENKRLYVRDLAPVGRRQVRNKKFVNCEIIGPASVIIGLQSNFTGQPPQLKDCNTFDVDCIEIDPSMRSQLAVEFWDCDFDGCNFYHMTMLFTGRYNPTLHWMTPDFRQPSLLPGANP